MINTKSTWLGTFFILLMTSIIWAQPLPGGPRAPSVILMIVGIVLLFRKKFSLRDRRLQRVIIIFSLFWAPTLLSLTSSYAPDKTLDLIVLLPLFVFLSVSAFYVLDHYLDSKLLLVIICSVCFFWLFDAAVQFVFDQDIFGVQRYEGERIVGPFADHLRLGLFISILSPIVLHYLERFGWVWQSAYLLVAVTIVMLTGVRTDLLTMVLAFILFVLATKRYRLLGVFIGIAIIAGSFAATQSSISESKLKTLNKIPETYQQWNVLSSYRLDIWQAGWNMFRDNPLTGVGGRSFENAYMDHSSPDNFFHNESRPVYHAHHPLISIVAETGILGLAGIIISIMLLYRWGKNAEYGAGLANPWGQILILIAFPIQSMPVFFTLWWFPFISFVLVCYLDSLESDRWVKAS